MNGQLSRAQIRQAIRANQALCALRPGSQQKLASGAISQQFDRGDVICHENAFAARFWLLLKGEVKLLKYANGGGTLLIDIILPDQIFGAVFGNHPTVYPCTAVTAKRAELLSLSLKDLLDELEENPRLQRILLADICDKLCHAQQMRGLWLEEAPVRIAHALLYLYRKFGGVIPQTRATLAELAGTTVETAIRISNALARRGILRLRRGQIEILSVPQLRGCAMTLSMRCIIKGCDALCHCERENGSGREANGARIRTRTERLTG